MGISILFFFCLISTIIGYINVKTIIHDGIDSSHPAMFICPIVSCILWTLLFNNVIYILQYGHG